MSGLSAGLDRQALLAQLFEAVSLAKGLTVPGQETLQRFLGSLLSVKDDVGEERRIRGALHVSRPQICRGFSEPRPAY
jgi:hypothetical protein